MRFLGFISFLVLSACSASLEETVNSLSSISANDNTVYNCSYFSRYDSLEECRTTTLANCSSEWHVYPGGGSGVCYYPPSGWESCSLVTANWIYTPYTSISCVVSPGVYRIARSVVGCDSTTCACLADQELFDDCTDGVDCPVTIPTLTNEPACQ